MRADSVFHRFILVFAVLIVGLMPMAAGAQNTVSDRFGPAEITEPELERLKRRAERDSELPAVTKNIAIARYDSAIEVIRAAERQKEKALRLERELNNFPETIEALKSDVKKAETDPIRERVSALSSGEAMLKLERELIAREGDMRTFNAEVDRYEAQLSNFSNDSVREELAATRGALAEISAELNEFGDSLLDTSDTARKTFLLAKQYLLQNTIIAFEQEVAAEPARQQIIMLRRDLAELKAKRAEIEVIGLQNLTGQRRVREASENYQEVQAGLSVLENAHPLVLDYAAENYRISGQLRDMAASAGVYPRLQADTRERFENVTSDLEDAEDLTTLGEINRRSSATLRRLRDQRISLKAVRAEVAENQRRILAATQNRLWARQRLRNMPIGQFDASQIIAEWTAENPGHGTLGQSDLIKLNSLYSARRALLQKMIEAAVYETEEARALSEVQTKLEGTATGLSEVLDQKLLWLPSVQSIDSGWPVKVWRGTFDVFSLTNMSRAGEVMGGQLKRFWFPLFLIGLMVAGLMSMRGRLRAGIIETSTKVGRVQQDSYWHTPNVLLSTGLLTAPLPILLFFTGVLFRGSGAPDNFIDALGKTGMDLSGFVWFFLIWKEWNKDKSLFHAHYKTPRVLRENAKRHLKWFLPFAGVSIALVTLTQNSREPDVYEGFSLLAFIVTAFALGWFSLRLLWVEKNDLNKAFSDNGFFRRYHRPILFLAVALPLAAAALAAIGYYDTARELLSRLFFSGGLIVATYALYGLLRRTVLVAQRRLALRQAIEKREQAAKLRAEQEAAEERGEAPQPPVNYDEIDVESLSRRSVQLINTFVIVGFGVLMWMFWRDLFPALSVFDNVNLWPSEWKETDGKSIPSDYVTLWNFIQSFAIAVLTYISAKNLPAFMEVFILNRSRLDRGARYAFVSVMGYVIFAVGFIWAFSKLGMDWSQLQWIAAALSVGIGFGLQEIIANFISGLIILFERPIRVGDYITIGDKSGTVRTIQIRATTLSDLDNREIFIPNKELITQKVTNWTLTDSITRIIIPIGVAYGTDTDKARDIMQDVLTKNPRVLEKPKSNVYFLGFGQSSLDFELRIFVRSVDDRFGVSHDLHTEINKAFAKAGIEIPFPQQDLHIKTEKS